MLILSILIIILTNAVTYRLDKVLSLNRVTIIILLSLLILGIMNFQINSISNGLGVYGGLFHITVITQSFVIFIAFFGLVVLLLSFTPKHFQDKSIIKFGATIPPGFFFCYYNKKKIDACVEGKRKMVFKLKQNLINTKRAVEKNPWFQRVVQVWRMNLNLNKIYLVIYLLGCIFLFWNIWEIFSSKPILVLFVLAILLTAISPLVYRYFNRLHKQSTRLKIFRVKLEQIIGGVVSNPLYKKISIYWKWFNYLRFLYCVLNLIDYMFNKHILASIYYMIELHSGKSQNLMMMKMMPSGSGSVPHDQNNPLRDQQSNIDLVHLTERCLIFNPEFQIPKLEDVSKLTGSRLIYVNKINQTKLNILNLVQEELTNYEKIELSKDLDQMNRLCDKEHQLEESRVRIKKHIGELTTLNKYDGTKDIRYKFNSDIGRVLENHGYMFPGHSSETIEEKCLWRKVGNFEQTADKLLKSDSWDVIKLSEDIPRNFDLLDERIRELEISNLSEVSMQCLFKQVIFESEKNCPLKIKQILMNDFRQHHLDLVFFIITRLNIQETTILNRTREKDLLSRLLRFAVNYHNLLNDNTETFKMKVPSPPGGDRFNPIGIDSPPVLDDQNNPKQYLLSIESIKKYIDLNIEGKKMQAETRQKWDKLDDRSKIIYLLSSLIKHYKIKLSDSWDINQLINKLMNKEGKAQEAILNPDCQTSPDNHKGKRRADQVDDLYQQGASQIPRMSQLGLNQSGFVIPSQIQRGVIYQQGSPAGSSQIIEKTANNWDEQKRKNSEGVSGVQEIDPRSSENYQNMKNFYKNRR